MGQKSNTCSNILRFAWPIQPEDFIRDEATEAIVRSLSGGLFDLRARRGDSFPRPTYAPCQPHKPVARPAASAVAHRPLPPQTPPHRRNHLCQPPAATPSGRSPAPPLSGHLLLPPAAGRGPPNAAHSCRHALPTAPFLALRMARQSQNRGRVRFYQLKFTFIETLKK